MKDVTNVAMVGFGKRGPMGSLGRRMTIEDQLEAKAITADRKDYARQRSLSDMSDDELMAFLLGG
jgi:hypothetical protein